MSRELLLQVEHLDICISGFLTGVTLMACRVEWRKMAHSNNLTAQHDVDDNGSSSVHLRIIVPDISFQVGISMLML